MYNLVGKLRDKNVKVKALRREGIVPATIYGRNLKESVHLQIPPADVNRFLSTASRGNTLTVEVGGEKYNAIFKNVTHEPIKRQVEHLEFQHIVADEAVNSVIDIILTNRDKNQNLILQHIEEIPYNALPRHFVQEVVIDLDGMKAGTIIKIEDLDIAKDENIKLTIAEDTVILTLTEVKKAAVEEDAEAEEEEE